MDQYVLTVMMILIGRTIVPNVPMDIGDFNVNIHAHVQLVPARMVEMEPENVYAL